jgi:hypothetical protein
MVALTSFAVLQMSYLPDLLQVCSEHHNRVLKPEAFHGPEYVIAVYCFAFLPLTFVAGPAAPMRMLKLVNEMYVLCAKSSPKRSRMQRRERSQKSHSLVMNMMKSDTHCCTNSLASFEIFAFCGRPSFMILLILAIGKNLSCSRGAPSSTITLSSVFVPAIWSDAVGTPSWFRSLHVFQRPQLFHPAHTPTPLGIRDL